LKKLQVIVKEGVSSRTLDDIVYTISQITGIDIKEKPLLLSVGTDKFYIWQNVLLDVDSTTIVELKRKLSQTLNGSIEEMPTTWWGRNGVKAFVFMGLASVAGLIIGILSWVTHSS